MSDKKGDKSGDMFRGLMKKLPTMKTKVGQGKRLALFRSFDPNGNGYLSLAEVDKGVSFKPFHGSRVKS